MQTDLTPSLQGIIASDWSAARVALGIVSDRELTRLALATVLSIYPEITVLGVDSGIDPNSELLAHEDLKLLVVNLPLEYINGRSPGLDFVRFVKQVRADVRVLLLKRRAEEQQIRASLEAGADGCCFQGVPAARLALAIKAVSIGAGWLDPGIADMILHGSTSSGHSSSHIEESTPAHPLSPREREILTLLSEGCSNDEIAEQLHCSVNTIKTHLTHIFRKLDVRDRVSAVVAAMRFALI